ncbi:hypothetical protein VDG1235_4351 [Verrucomicrobiia bacterium DG1235]|nr:hypothetical protein VDG1235_4351 [Verrucomicrobiae bacterium DG1235]
MKEAISEALRVVLEGWVAARMKQLFSFTGAMGTLRSRSENRRACLIV